MRLRVREMSIRSLDIFGALIGLFVSAIPVFIIGFMVKKDGGPVFF
ncbi:Protein of unknown function [Leuconostoc citreum]|nr:Protein of unknown function [Leuconostoc citreum]